MDDPNRFNIYMNDDSSSDSSDDESIFIEESSLSSTKDIIQDKKNEIKPFMKNSENIFFKLMFREHTGYLNHDIRGSFNRQPYTKVPNRLNFCLKEIIPYCYLKEHMFMGLSADGQFLISYKVCYDENELTSDYTFNAIYKYTLYFWIYRPHQPLGKYFTVCLFDDHGVDNLKSVSMTQWKNRPRILVVHGAPESENEDSYLTIIRVPKLGCLDCKKLRDIDSTEYLRCDNLCIKCNLTIHTKYATMETDPKFNPYMNLICPERIIIISNGFIHMIHVELEFQKLQKQQQHMQQNHQQNQLNQNFYNRQIISIENRNIKKIDNQILDTKQDNSNKHYLSGNIVDRIIADFSEFETDTYVNEKLIDKNKAVHLNCNELVITCATKKDNNDIKKKENSIINKDITNSKFSLLNNQSKRTQKIISKSTNNCITNINLTSTNINRSTETAICAYEFSEDNENCEKIGTFRKRRLADKKYEFSEDNSENIVPFTKTRPIRVHRAHTGNHHHTTSGGTIYLSSSTTQSYETTTHVHRASPSQGFRSPCGSPVGNQLVLRSPTSRPHYYHQSLQKLNYPLSPSSHHVNTKLNSPLSPRRTLTNQRINCDLENPSSSNIVLLKRDDNLIHNNAEEPEMPSCTKKFKRRFVEEDDAASVITSEEDDCISPGYHTSLPVEVHGSCYSVMQMISQSSYHKLSCPAVVITQHSFDLETFVYYTVNHLCQKHNKFYDVFYDGACELINVNPSCLSILCLYIVHFTARDKIINNTRKCGKCSRSIECHFHKKIYECRILFSWNMDTGDWTVLDFGELSEVTSDTLRSLGLLSKTAKNIASELSSNLNKMHNNAFNLRVLDSNIDKSKRRIIDEYNLIEFYRKRSKIIDDISY